MLCATLTGEIRKTSNDLTKSWMPSLCSYMQGILAKQSSLSNGQSEISVYHWVAGFSSMPAHRMSHTSPAHPAGRIREHHIFMWVCLPLPLILHSVPDCSSCVALFRVQSSLGPEWVWLVSILFVQCQVSWVYLSLSSHGDITTSPKGRRRGDYNIT